MVVAYTLSYGLQQSVQGYALPWFQTCTQSSVESSRVQLHPHGKTRMRSMRLTTVSFPTERLGLRQLAPTHLLTTRFANAVIPFLHGHRDQVAVDPDRVPSSTVVMTGICHSMLKCISKQCIRKGSAAEDMCCRWMAKPILIVASDAKEHSSQHVPRKAPESGWLVKMFACMRSVMFLPMRLTTVGSLPCFSTWPVCHASYCNRQWPIV